MKFKTFLKNSRIKNEIENLTDDCFILTEYQKIIFDINVKVDEKTSLPKVDKKTLKKAINYLTKKFDIDESDLEYIGFTDLSFIKKDSKLLQFNIMKKGHSKFGSTVAYKT